MPVYSCSQLAVWADGREVTTVEGLGDGTRLDPLQQAFIDGDGPQCGFCTSGQLMSAKAVVTANANPTEDDVRQGMTGNICRCSNYNRYVAAVMSRPPERPTDRAPLSTRREIPPTNRRARAGHLASAIHGRRDACKHVVCPRTQESVSARPDSRCRHESCARHPWCLCRADSRDVRHHLDKRRFAQTRGICSTTRSGLSATLLLPWPRSTDTQPTRR